MIERNYIVFLLIYKFCFAPLKRTYKCNQQVNMKKVQVQFNVKKTRNAEHSSSLLRMKEAIGTLSDDRCCVKPIGQAVEENKQERHAEGLVVGRR